MSADTTADCSKSTTSSTWHEVAPTTRATWHRSTALPTAPTRAQPADVTATKRRRALNSEQDEQAATATATDRPSSTQGASHDVSARGHPRFTPALCSTSLLDDFIIWWG